MLPLISTCLPLITSNHSSLTVPATFISVSSCELTISILSLKGISFDIENGLSDFCSGIQRSFTVRVPSIAALPFSVFADMFLILPDIYMTSLISASGDTTVSLTVISVMPLPFNTLLLTFAISYVISFSL